MSTSNKKNEWTWQEISTHNHRDSCWIYVNDDVYDVTPWLSNHPGGEHLVLLFSGRDCTEAMRAYHPFTDKPYAILEKLKIGKLKGRSELVRWDPDTGFYKAVRERVGEYFKKRKIDPSRQTYTYEFFRFLLIVGYLLGATLNLGPLRGWGASLFIRSVFSSVISLVGILIALDIVHMCSHLPLFRKSKLNYFIGWFSFDVCLGISYDVWLHEHVVGHHQYTNIVTIDPNAAEGHGEEAVYRCSPNQKWYNRFYYQFIWLPLLAFMVVIEYRMAPYRYWFKGYRKEIRINGDFISKRAFAVFTLGKLIWVFRVFYVPVVYWGIPLWEALFLQLIGDIMGGYFVGLTLPANHLTTNVDWPLAKQDEKTGGWNMGSEWAVAQLTTCKDYAVESWFFSHVMGALNNHSCHHLFPAMHHSYYAQIYPIVRQTAKEWNIKPPVVGTYGDLLHDFVKNLWDLGTQPSIQPNSPLTYL